MDEALGRVRFGVVDDFKNCVVLLFQDIVSIYLGRGSRRE